MADFYLRQDFARRETAQLGSARDLLHWAEDICRRAPAADVYREKEGRITVRVQFGHGEYFVKLHRGIGWAEIAGNLLRGRLPVLGAGDEYRALRTLQRTEVSTPRIAAYAQLGGNPARRRSVIVTDSLVDTQSLEDFCVGWRQSPPGPLAKMQLIRAVAELARALHGAGVNHRDFYLCHIHLRQPAAPAARPDLVLIDLHRAQVRHRVPGRWRVKDLAGLYFSAMDLDLGPRDLLRFLRHYTPGGLRAALGQQTLWRSVERRARAMHRRAARGRAA
ncbi:MAG: lipopolysaccharide core heptose(I) kinase RfaP [Halioglobus sp.]